VRRRIEMQFYRNESPLTVVGERDENLIENTININRSVRVQRLGGEGEWTWAIF